MNLNDYITRADQQIAQRKEISSPDKIIAELSLGFWVVLFNKTQKSTCFAGGNVIRLCL
jgi:hypothetical protein